GGWKKLSGNFPQRIRRTAQNIWNKPEITSRTRIQDVRSRRSLRKHWSTCRVEEKKQPRKPCQSLTRVKQRKRMKNSIRWGRKRMGVNILRYRTRQIGNI